MKLSPSAIEALGKPSQATLSLPDAPHPDADTLKVTLNKDNVPIEYVKQSLMGTHAAVRSAFDIPFNGKYCRVWVDAVTPGGIARICQATSVSIAAAPIKENVPKQKARPRSWT